MHKFLIFSISRIVIRNQPGDAFVYVFRHVHVTKGIDERCPWNFSKKFRWKVLGEFCEILKRLNRTEILLRHPSRINSNDYSVALTSSNNRSNIRNPLCSMDCLNVKSPIVRLYTSAVSLVSRLGRFRRIVTSCFGCFAVSTNF